MDEEEPRGQTHGKHGHAGQRAQRLRVALGTVSSLLSYAVALRRASANVQSDVVRELSHLVGAPPTPENFTVFGQPWCSSLCGRPSDAAATKLTGCFGIWSSVLQDIAFESQNEPLMYFLWRGAVSFGRSQC